MIEHRLDPRPHHRTARCSRFGVHIAEDETKVSLGSKLSLAPAHLLDVEGIGVPRDVVRPLAWWTEGERGCAFEELLRLPAGYALFLTNS